MKSKSELCDKLNCSEHRTEWNSVDKRRRRWRNSKRGNISVLSEWGGFEFRMAEEGGGGKGDGKKGDVSVCRDFLRNVCTRGDRCESMLSLWWHCYISLSLIGKNYDGALTMIFYLGASLPIQRERMLHHQGKRGAQSFRFTPPPVFLQISLMALYLGIFNC